MNIQTLTEDIEITKDILYSLFCSEKTGKLSSPLLRWSVIKKHNKLYRFITTYYDGIDDTNTSASEIFYRIINDIDEHPKCPICNKNTTFKRIRDGYYTCCDECRRNGNWRKYNGQLNVKQNLEKYGVTSLMKLQVNKDKVKATCRKLYGVDTVSQYPEFKEKRKRTYKERYTNNSVAKQHLYDKRKQTSLIKYGVEHPAQCIAVQDKMKSTCLHRYGVENIVYSEQFKEKFKQTCNKHYGVDAPMQSKSIRKKAYNSMKLHNSFGKSKIEKAVENYFIDNNVEYISQYSSNEYPFMCDFYLIKYAMYIEIQGTWLHGNHPYDETNVDDIERLKYWKNKGTGYYKQAIKVWTISDVEKRKVAKISNLNYLEIFSCDANEVIDAINNYIENKNSGYKCIIYEK